MGPDSSFFGRIWSHQDGDIRSHSHQDGEIRSHSHQKAVVEQNRVYFTCKYIALNFFYFLHRSDLTTSQRNAEELAPGPPAAVYSSNLVHSHDLANGTFTQTKAGNWMSLVHNTTTLF